MSIALTLKNTPSAAYECPICHLPGEKGVGHRRSQTDAILTHHVHQTCLNSFLSGSYSDLNLNI